MHIQRALEIALGAAAETRYRSGLPLQKVEITTPDGYGLAHFEYFDRPGYVSLQKRFEAAGGQAKTFTTICEHGKQKTLLIWFLEVSHDGE